MAGRFWVETLGCPKNQVDSDKLMGTLLDDGLVAAPGPEVADVVVVKTCAFIEEARQESVDTILELADRKPSSARLVVTGCLAERHPDRLIPQHREPDVTGGDRHRDQQVGRLRGDDDAVGDLARLDELVELAVMLPVEPGPGPSGAVAVEDVVADGDAVGMQPGTHLAGRGVGVPLGVDVLPDHPPGLPDVKLRRNVVALLELIPAQSPLPGFLLNLRRHCLVVLEEGREALGRLEEPGDRADQELEDLPLQFV
jgi:hypothetical protein